MKAVVIPPGDPRDVMQEAWDAIEMTRLCQQLQCLPGSGGLYDQDSKHVWLMKQVLLADMEKSKLDEQRRPKS